MCIGLVQFVSEEDEENMDVREGLRVAQYESPLDFRAPMGFIFYLAILSE